MCLEFISTVKFLLASCQTLKWTFVLLHSIVYQFVSLQFVLSIKCCWANVTLEGIITSMNQNVRAQVILRLKTLLTDVASKLADRSMGD